MSNKIVVISDIHLIPNDKYGNTLPDGTNSRLNDKLDYIKFAVKHAIKIKAKAFICLGDIFHRPNPNETLRNAFLEAISPLAGKVPAYFLVGNHDIAPHSHSLMSENTLSKSLDSTWMRVIPTPEIIKMPFTDIPFLFIPWMKDDEVRKQLQENEDCLVFGHFGVKGAYASGTEFELTEGVEQRLFDNHVFAILGHYHAYQETDNWMYVGSLARMDISERKDPKGFLELDFDGDEFTYEFINVPERVFYLHQILETEDPTFKDLDDWESLEGYIVKLVFIGTENWYFGFNHTELKTKLARMGAHKIFIDRQSVREHRVKTPEINSSSSWDEGLKSGV